MADKPDDKPNPNAPAPDPNKPDDKPAGDPNPTPEKPKLAGKFNNAEELEKAYKELERKLGAPKPGDPLQIGNEPGKVPDGEKLDTRTLIGKAGLNETELESQWTQNGKLTDEQYTALHKVRPSLTKADIDLLARGLTAEAVLVRQAVTAAITESEKIVGGKDQLGNLIAWAGSPEAALSQAEKDDINARLKDPRTTLAAVKQLNYMHRDAVGAGKASPLVAGQGMPNAANSVKTIADYQALERRVLAGDKSAAALLMTIDTSKLV